MGSPFSWQFHGVESEAGPRGREAANGQLPGLSQVVEVGLNLHTFTFICFLYLVSIFNII